MVNEFLKTHKLVLSRVSGNRPDSTRNPDEKPKVRIHN